jgi:hypothetical protein
VNFINFVEQTKTRLINELQELFGNPTVSDLPLVAETLEERLRSYLDELLFFHAALFLPEAVPGKDLRVLQVGDEEYAINIGEDIIQSEVLSVAIVPRTLRAPQPNYRELIVNLHGVGRYQKIQIKLPVSLSIRSEPLGQLANTVFETGYEWLNRTTRTVVRQVQANLATALYDYLRILLPQRDVTAQVCFGAVTKSRGYYVIDETMIASAIDSVHGEAATVGVSPARLVAEFMSKVMPFETMHCKAAIISGDCIDVDLRKSKYSGPASLYRSAEIAILSSPSISIFPLVCEGQAYLVAVFPTDLKDLLKPVFTAHKSEFAALFNNAKSSLRRILAVLEEPRRRMAYGRIGEFVGGVLKGLMDI